MPSSRSWSPASVERRPRTWPPSFPGDLSYAIPEEAEAESFGEQVFLGRIAELLDATEETAQWDASAVLTSVAEAFSGGQLNHLLSRLPSDYADFFGKPDLA